MCIFLSNIFINALGSLIAIYVGYILIEKRLLDAQRKNDESQALNSMISSTLSECIINLSISNRLVARFKSELNKPVTQRKVSFLRYEIHAIKNFVSANLSHKAQLKLLDLVTLLKKENLLLDFLISNRNELANTELLPELLSKNEKARELIKDLVLNYINPIIDRYKLKIEKYSELDLKNFNE